MDSCDSLCINHTHITSKQSRELSLYFIVCWFGNLAILEYLSKNFESLRYFDILFKNIVSIPQIQVCKWLKSLVQFILSIHPVTRLPTPCLLQHLLQLNHWCYLLETYINLEPHIPSMIHLYGTKLEYHFPMFYSILFPTGLELSVTLCITLHRNSDPHFPTTRTCSKISYHVSHPSTNLSSVFGTPHTRPCPTLPIPYPYPATLTEAS